MPQRPKKPVRTPQLRVQKPKTARVRAVAKRSALAVKAPSKSVARRGANEPLATAEKAGKARIASKPNKTLAASKSGKARALGKVGKTLAPSKVHAISKTPAPAQQRARAIAKPPRVTRPTAPRLKARAKLAPKVIAIAPKAKLARTKTSPAAPAAKARAIAEQSVRSPRSLILPPKPLESSGERAGVADLARAVSTRTPGLRKAATDESRTLSVAPEPSPQRKPRAALNSEAWQKLEALATRLGRAALDREQRLAITRALAGRHSLIVQPDDERAISCYELSAQLLDQPTVVLSPIAAALAEQCAILRQHELAAVCISSDLADAERGAALARVARGGSLLVFITPEALRANDVRAALTRSGIALFVVEEAQLASKLSHEQRPSYVELGTTLKTLAAPPVMALTRIATHALRKDIAERLELGTESAIVSPPVRDNVQLASKLSRGEGRQASLVRLVEGLELPGIVFCATPHDADSVYAALRGAGIAALRHHSALPPTERAAALASFLEPAPSVMVTVSPFAPGSGVPGIGDQPETALGFGRGTRKANVRFVVHYQSPASLEQYLREIQHAGRDGLPALCVLLHESSHRSLHEVMHAQHRFKATHLAELARALETPALENRPVTLEALALGTGQSRRTTDRLTALLADAGVVTRTGGWVRVACTATELDEACRRLGVQLYALREGDARRLAAVSAYAESSECKLSCLNQYLEGSATSACQRCNACVSELLAPSLESLVPRSTTRRPQVQDFSVQTQHPYSGFVSQPSRDSTLTSKLGDAARSGAWPRD